MATYVSLLRGVNVAGQRKVGMDELRELFQSMGFMNVRSYIQSGNVIFEHSNIRTSSLEAQIEDRLRRNFHSDIAVLVRTRAQLENVVRNNPYSFKDESRVHITFLRDNVANFPTGEVRKSSDHQEDFSHSGREVYLFLPNDQGRTKLSNSFFEKALKVTATTRNLRTTKALCDMASRKTDQ